MPGVRARGLEERGRQACLPARCERAIGRAGERVDGGSVEGRAGGNMHARKPFRPAVPLLTRPWPLSFCAARCSSLLCPCAALLCSVLRHSRGLAPAALTGEYGPDINIDAVLPIRVHLLLIHSALH